MTRSSESFAAIVNGLKTVCSNGTPEGRSVFATVSKNIERETGLPFAPYAGVTYGTFDDRLRPIGGLNINFSERVSGLVMFDGVRVHPLINFSHDRHVFSFILVKGREPGVTYSITF